MNLPNWITLTRVLLTPVLVLCLIYENYTISLILFSFTTLTDILDGFLARFLNQITPLGSFLDPMADKLMIISSLIVVVYLKQMPFWFLVVTFSRDLFLIIGFCLIYILTKKAYILPSYLGKITTFSQMLAIWIIIIKLSGILKFNDQHIEILIYTSGCITVASGLDYLVRGIMHLHETPEIDLSVEKMRVRKND